MDTLLYFVASLLMTQVVLMGHAAARFAFAKRLGLQVARVRIGWGPKLATRTRDGVDFEVRALPPLAMVAVRGHDPQEGSPDYRALYGQNDLGKRLLLTLSSPAFYVLLTVLPLFAIALFVGWPGEPTASPMVVDRVEPDSPADLAGITPGDTIVRAGGSAVHSAKDLIAVVSRRGGVPTEFELRRAGRPLSVTATPRSVSGKGMVGVTPKLAWSRRQLGLLDAGVTAFAYPWKAFAQQLWAFGDAIKPQREPLMGPIAMSAAIAQEPDDRGLNFAIATVTALGLRFWLYCCFPLPFCAAGRLLLLLPETLGRRQPSRRAERWMLRLTLGAYFALLTLTTLADFAAL